MAVAQDFLNGVRKGLGGFNEAVLAGLTDTQIAAATGVAGLRTTIESLALLAGTSLDDLRRASEAVQMGADIGVLTDTNIQAAATAADIRVLFTAEDSTVSATFTGDAPQ